MTRNGLTPSQPLQGDPDPEERFARFPSSYTIKGMFFARPIHILGPGYEALEPKLRRPQAKGRYLPFGDYPQEDYSRLAHAAAVKRWPHVSTPEAMRQLARDDLRAFAESRVGRVVLAMTGDVAGTLLKLPDMYRMSLEGGHVEATRTDDGVRIEYRDFLGWVDCYPIGTVEGVVQHYGAASELDVQIHGNDAATYDVRWR
ncbi:MAG: DUF2378 family protein [Polyangiales bacterium]